MTVDKEKAILNWIRTLPNNKNKFLLDYLGEKSGSCTIIPIAGEAQAKDFIGGMKEVTYDFMIQVTMSISDTTDTVNTDNMYLQRKWQDWIDEQEKLGDYPDFGADCSCYELKNLANMPQLAQISGETRKAVYQFAARLTYLEER